jgi:hypothetical protein
VVLRDIAGARFVPRYDATRIREPHVAACLADPAEPLLCMESSTPSRDTACPMSEENVELLDE